MANIEVKTNFTNGLKMDGAPPWKNGDLRQWWGNGTTYDFFYSTVQEENKETIYTQQGNDSKNYAAVKFLVQTIEIITQRINPDNSLTVTYKMKVKQWNNYIKPNTVGFYTEASLLSNNNVIWSFSGTSTTPINWTSEDIVNTVTVAPNSFENSTNLIYKVRYPGTSYPEYVANVGFVLFNPNLPLYTPLATRRGGRMLSHNNFKLNMIRRNQNYTDIGKLSYNDVGTNNGSIRVRKNGNYLQSTKIGE